MKTLVFVQTVPLVESAVEKFRELLNAQPVILTDEEKALFDLTSEEMGSSAQCYLTLEEDGSFAGGAIGHHSLLLREERILHESLFKRSLGVNVLFATSTLAQGMNLPSEVVIISGDSRFDPKVDRLAQLEAHELLNAAGRAGRAGESSQGFVLIVPSRVVSFDDTSNLIGSHWMTLQSIFSQSDQCLDIDDPLTLLLDKIHAGTFEGMPFYLLSRLPPADVDGTDEPLRKLLSNSFGAFRARRRGDDGWVESRIQAAFVARKQQTVSGEEAWLDKVAGLTGVSVDSLREIADLFERDMDTLTTRGAVERLMSWLQAKPSRLLEVVRPENISDFFGGTYDKLDSDQKKGECAVPVVERFLNIWMSGAPLNQMEVTHSEKHDLKRCKHARHFVLRLLPDLAFLAGLPARLAVARCEDEEYVLPLVISTLGAAVREGCDSPDALAVRIYIGRSKSRVAARHRYNELRPYILRGEPTESFDETLTRVRQAAEMLEISQNL